MTLAEVILALGLLAVVGLIVVGVFTKSMGAQSKSSHATVGRLLAESIAEKAVLIGPPNWGMADIDIPETETVRLQNSDSEETYTYDIDEFVVRGATATNSLGVLYLIEITVSWWGEDDRVGMGKNFVKTARVVYHEN